MTDVEASPAPAKRGLTPSRIVLFILLAVAVCALVIDLRARSACQLANDLLENTIKSNKGQPASTSPDEVHKLLGREPDTTSGENASVELYVWQGALRKYTLWVIYTPGEKPALKDVAQNKRPY